MIPKSHVWLLIAFIFIVGASIGGFAGWSLRQVDSRLKICIDAKTDLEWEKAQLYAGLVRTAEQENEDEIAMDRDVELIGDLRSEIARLKAQRALIEPYMKSGALIVQERQP
jgi:hypothetical protein